MPDEHSNLNLPAAAGSRPSNRRRGRRGGRSRSRGSRPASPPAEAHAGEISPASEAVEFDAPPAGMPEPADHAEDEAESAGGFREPHPEVPAEFAAHDTEPVETHEVEPAAEIQAAMEPPRVPEPPRDRRPERQPEPQRPRPWVKPADFRPAEASAISQAVEHATEVAASLKQMIDHLDEVLELVEVAERQKLADEREIDELRRALRRIQPPRREPPQPPSRGPRRDEPRRDEPRREPREQNQRRDDPRRPVPEPPAEALPPENSEPPAAG